MRLRLLLLLTLTAAGCAGPRGSTTSVIEYLPLGSRLDDFAGDRASLDHVADRIRLFTGAWLALDPRLRRVWLWLDDAPSFEGDWRTWLRAWLARYPARLVRRGAGWRIEPTAELGPVLKELPR